MEAGQSGKSKMIRKRKQRVQKEKQRIQKEKLMIQKQQLRMETLEKVDREAEKHAQSFRWKSRHR